MTILRYKKMAYLNRKQTGFQTILSIRLLAYALTMLSKLLTYGCLNF